MAATLAEPRVMRVVAVPTPIPQLTTKTLAAAVGGTAVAAGMAATLGTLRRLAMVLVEHRFLVPSAISSWVAAAVQARAMMAPLIRQMPMPPGSTAAVRPEEESSLF